METYDLAVIGVGGMGSAIVAHAAARKLKVLGLEQFSIPNIRGSSHGATRILRLGLHEGPTYVPLVLRAVELWKQLGEKIGTPIFHNCGGLDVALPDSRIFEGAKAACEKFGVAHEILDAAETHRRFPAIKPASDMLTVYQPGSGFVLPELAITAQVNLGLENGAEIHGHERVLGCRTHRARLVFAKMQSRKLQTGPAAHLDRGCAGHRAFLRLSNFWNSRFQTWPPARDSIARN